MAGCIAIYDACVLYPAPLRDFLVQLSLSGLFQAKWTNRIHDEWIGNLLEDRSDLKRQKLENTRRAMNEATRDCLVEGYEPLIENVKLPDEADRHVLAAAIHAHANFIVTFNLRDFPATVLNPLGVQAIHPDDFVMRLTAMDSTTVCAAARKHLARLRHPAKTVEEYILTLSAQRLSRTAKFLRANLALKVPS